MDYINNNYVLKPIYNDENECINDMLSILKGYNRGIIDAPFLVFLDLESENDR